jgi:hypothetical protein
MATTVEAASLTVTITESVSLANHTYGNNRSKQFVTQGEVDQRIMSIAASGEASFTTILALSTVDAKGQVVVANFGYFRITNLDDTNFVTLQLYISATKMYYIKLEPGESYMLMSPDADTLCEAGTPSLADITQINGDADTSACDIEYVIVTSGAAT